MFNILAAIALWSSIGLVIRLSGAPVHMLIFFSCVISTVFTAFLLFWNKQWAGFPTGKTLAYLMALGPISLLNTYSFYYAYGNTTIANAVVTHYIAPIIVAFLAPLFLKESLTPRIFIAVAIATAGLWVMFDVSINNFLGSLAAGDRNTAGIIAGLVSGVAYASLIIIFRVYVQNFGPLIMVFSQNSIASMILLPFVRLDANLTSHLWAFLVMGIIHSLIAPILYFRGMKEVTANKAAILGYLEPVCAILLGILFLHEYLGYKTLVGGLMVLYSGYLTIRNA